MYPAFNLFILNVQIYAIYMHAKSSAWKLVQIFRGKENVFCYFSARPWRLQMKVHTLPINERVSETV